MGEFGRIDVEAVVCRYAAGWFPLFDERDRFYWERLEERAVLPLDGEAAVRRARRVGRRGRGLFEIRYTTAVEEVIRGLQRVRENNWVKGEVVAIYRGLHEAGLLRTVEAWEVEENLEVQNLKVENREEEKRGRLVGAVVGIVLPGVFVAETMYGEVGEASKACLCRLVEDCARAGYEMIDVQMAHDELWDEEGELKDGRAHPCVRLGERRMGVEVFVETVAKAWRRKFDGGAGEWVEEMRGRRERGIGK